MFEPVRGKPDFPAIEASIAALWRSRGTYQKSLDQRRDGKRFVFYEGPPTANGMPHPGHCLTRTIKDLYPRYRTMRGDFCERKAGWDTYGLPVEVEVCKELGRERTAWSSSRRLSSSTGWPISSRRRGSTGIGITGCLRRTTG